MTQKKVQKISLIGPGSVGSALLSALGSNGYQINAVFSRHQTGIVTANGDIEFGTQSIDNSSDPERDSNSGVRLKSGLPTSEQELGDLLFITTPDDSIEEVASELARSGLNWTSKYIVHCSGVRSSSALDSLSQAGAECASFHPMQTFSSSGRKVNGEKLFQSISVGIEGASGLSGELARIALSIGARPIILNKKQKQLIHIAAVFISNYNVVLAAIADELLQGELDNEDVHILDSLLLQTAKNICLTSPSEALTGPVSRGDVETVQQHLDILKDRPEINNIYKLMGKKALELSLNKESIGRMPAAQLRLLFES